MKFSKFLPIAMAVTLATSGASFAADQTGTPDANLIYTLTLGKYFNITKASTHQTANAQYPDDYITLNLDQTLDANFTVTTNNDTDAVKVYAKCQGKTGQIQALYSTAGGTDASDLKIVFTKASSAGLTLETASAANVGNSKATSKDVIAFTFDTSVAPSNQLTQKIGTVGAPSFAGGAITYSITDSGKYLFPYAIGTSAADSSFDANDSEGTYTATLYIEQTTL